MIIKEERNSMAEKIETDDMIIGKLRKEILSMGKPKKKRAKRKKQVILSDEPSEVKEYIRIT